MNERMKLLVTGYLILDRCQTARKLPQIALLLAQYPITYPSINPDKITMWFHHTIVAAEPLSR